MAIAFVLNVLEHNGYCIDLVVSVLEQVEPTCVVIGARQDSKFRKAFQSAGTVSLSLISFLLIGNFSVQ